MSDHTSEPTAEQVWYTVLADLASKVSQHNLKSWFQPLQPVELSDGTLHLRAEDEFKRAYIEDNYLDLLEDAIARVDSALGLSLRSEDEPPEAEAPSQMILPFIPESQRAQPTSFTRSALFGVVKRGQRSDLKDYQIPAWKGVSITYTGEQLDQNDLDVWLQCHALMQDHELGEPVVFSARGFLKELGRHAGKSDYRWLERSFKRLIACAIDVRVDGGPAYIGSLIQDYARPDESRQHFALTLNPAIGRLFHAALTRVDWQTRLELTTQLAKWLQFHIQSHKATRSNPQRISLEYLHDLSASDYSRMRDFRAKVKKAMAELKVHGIVASWKIRHGKTLEFVRPAPALDVR